MDRKDFIERGELKVDFLRNYRLVRKWACKTNEIQEADFELLLYLDPLTYFTRGDFLDGVLYYSWDKKRFYRLINDGWIEKMYDRADNGNKGHNKYKVSTKGKQMISRIYRILIGKEEIPESARRNSIMKGNSFSDKMYKLAIEKMNRQKR